MPEKKEKKTRQADTLSLYEKLSAPFPQEAIQRTIKEETKKGYDTTGIGYAYCVNRFNEICGLDSWGYDWKIIKEIEGKYKSGVPNFEICVELAIWLKSKENMRKCVGGHLAISYADALKGAITNAFKKTAAFWGVGKQAYEGSIDDDNVQRKEGEIDRVSIEKEKSLNKKEKPEGEKSKQAESGFYVAIERALEGYDEITIEQVHKIIADKDLTREQATRLLKDLKKGAFDSQPQKTTEKVLTKQQLFGLKLTGSDKLGFKGSHVLTNEEKKLNEAGILDPNINTNTVINDLQKTIKRRKEIETILIGEDYKDIKIEGRVLKWIEELGDNEKIKALVNKIDWNADADSILAYLNEQKARTGRKMLFE